MNYLLNILIFSFILNFSTQAQSDILGVWYNASKNSKIEIFKKGNEYFGKIVWLEDPLDEDTGKPLKDKENPDKSMRDNQILGMTILKDFTYDSKNKEYAGGAVYDPENGKTYKAKISLPSKNELDLRGYVGIPAFGRTENWTRAEK